jgi:hypothetical protein
MISIAMLSLMVAINGPVQRWSSSVPIEGEEITFSDRGVAVRPPGEVIPVMIPWFDLKSLPSGWAGEAQPYEDIAALARTAHTRRLRGDPEAAEEQYLALSEKIKPERGEQALDIALGLLQVALASAKASAKAGDEIIPWLKAIRIDQASASNSVLGIDQRTGLHPEIVPVFAEKSTAEIEQPVGLGEREMILFSYYQLASAKTRSGQADEALNELFRRARILGEREIGIQFVHEIVKCQIDSDPTSRRAARDSLRRRLRSGEESWAESWIHLALGVSLLAEPGVSDRELGVLECITVVVSHRDTPSSIVGLAAELAAEYLRSTGRDLYADTILVTAFVEDEPTTGSRP